MIRLEQPQFLIDAARQHGVIIDKYTDFDEQKPLGNVAAQFHGEEPDFGCCFGEFGCDASHNGDAQFGSFLRHIIGRKADRKLRHGLGSVVKVVGKVGAIASFAIPGIGPLVGTSAVAAMAAADKVLGGTSPADKAKLINNTKAMAALGDPHAKRGALVLSTVDQIRTAKGAKSGQAVIQPPHPIDMKKYTKTHNAPQIAMLAQKAPVKRAGWWTRFKSFMYKHLHGHAKVVATAKTSTTHKAIHA